MKASQWVFHIAAYTVIVLFFPIYQEIYFLG